MNWRTTARRMIIDQVIVVALAVVRILSFLSTFFTHDDHQSEEGDEKSQSHRDGGSASPVAMKPVAADCLISGLAFGLYKSLMLSYHCFEPLASLFDIPNPTPPLFAVSDITATSVKLSWTVDESGKPCKRGRLIIEVNGLVVGELRCDETAVVVGRLKPAQRYRFRVWAEGAGAGGIVRRGTSEILVRTLDDDVEKPVDPESLAIENLVPIEPKIVKAEIEKHDKTEKSELLEDAESIRTQIEQLENVIANTEQSNAHLEHSLRTQLSALESQRVPPDPAVKSALAELQGQLEQQEEELKNAEIQRSSLRKTLDERKSVYQKQKDQLQSLKEQCGEFVNRKDGKMDSASNTKDPHKEKDSKEELEKQIRELDARWEESKVLLKQLQTRKQDLEREALEVRKARYTAMTSAIPEYPVDVLSVEPVSLASQLEFGPEERRAFRNEMEMMRESLYISPTDVDHSVPDLGVLEIAHERPLETKKATLNPLAPAWQSPDPVVTHHTGDSSSSASMARSTTSRLDPRAPEWEAASYESEWGSGWNTAVGMQREAHGYGDIQGENPSVNNEKLDLEEVWGPGLRDDAWAASPSAVGERLSNLVTDMDMEEIAAVSGSVSGHNVPTTWSEPLRDTWPAPPNVVPVDLSGTLPAPPYKHTWHAPAKDRARDMVLKSRRSCDVGGIWSQHHGGGASGSGRGRSTSSYEHFATGLFGNIGTASPSLPLKTPYVGEPFSGMLDGRSSPGMPISGRKEGRSNSYGDTSTTEKPQLMPRMTGTPTPGGFHTLSPSSSTANSNMNLKGGVSTTSLSTTSCSVTDVVAPVPREFTRSALLSPYPSLGNVHGGSDRYATGEGGRLMATPPPPGFETKSLRGVSGSGGSVHRGDGSVGEERERDREHARTRSLGVWGVWGWEEK